MLVPIAGFFKRYFSVPALLFVLHVVAIPAVAQDSAFARSVVDTLAGPYFWGRGYTRDGMQKAAAYLQQQFSRLGLQPMGSSFTQPFAYNVNTFPGAMQVMLDGRLLQPGIDYILAPESRGLNATGQLRQQDSMHFIDAAHRLVVVKEDKLTWSVAQDVADYTVVQLDKHRNPGVPRLIRVLADNQLVQSFAAANIAGMVKGTQHPDSFLLVTAHYDHLGSLGDATYFSGANDNASGIGLLLSLARYYAAHPQPYSIGFIGFAGEEAGLLGSRYFTEHPLVPLQQVAFLLNIDLAGTGEEGITVVNATVYPEAFQLLRQQNALQHALTAIHPRGKAANSDHYWFTEKGVPAFFLYTMGGIRAYHDVFDKAATLPLNKIDALCSLVKDFFTAWQQQGGKGR